MTRKEFIALLTTEWPDVAEMLEWDVSNERVIYATQASALTRLCSDLAAVAFANELTGPVADALRKQVLSLHRAGVFDFAEES